MTADEAGHQEGTIPADQGVSIKVASVDRQQELIATSACAAGRDGAYERSRTGSAGPRATPPQQAGTGQKAVDLSAMGREVERELRDAEPERRVEFIVDEDIHAQGDPVLLRSAFTNLLGNAWKFTAKRTDAKIEVGKIKHETGAMVFFVKDNGAGFEMKYADRLFTLFQRMHRQDEFPGTGIGLATVQKIIRKHGGRIWAESQPHHGATFFFTLQADSSS